MAKRKAAEPINNLVVISDTHCGDSLAIMPEGGVILDDGGEYHPSKIQIELWKYWREFWDEFVPKATRGEPFALVHNGDAIDGVHHGSTNQITHNLTTQRQIAYELLEPVVKLCEGRYYHIRGTEAHVGRSGQEEEALARQLKAIPNREGQYARYDLFKMLGAGKESKLVHLLHHIGTTGSQAYEATAIGKEIVEMFVESGRWNRRFPDCLVRSHRHRNYEIRMPTHNGSALAVVTPAWQAKTAFAWKIPGARISLPQWGGIVIRISDGELFVRSFVKSPEPSPIE